MHCPFIHAQVNFYWNYSTCLCVWQFTACMPPVTSNTMPPCIFTRHLIIFVTGRHEAQLHMSVHFTLDMMEIYWMILTQERVTDRRKGRDALNIWLSSWFFSTKLIKILERKTDGQNDDFLVDRYMTFFSQFSKEFPVVVPASAVIKSLDGNNRSAMSKAVELSLSAIVCLTTENTSINTVRKEISRPSVWCSVLRLTTIDLINVWVQMLGNTRMHQTLPSKSSKPQKATDHAFARLQVIHY